LEWTRKLVVMTRLASSSFTYGDFIV